MKYYLTIGVHLWQDVAPYAGAWIEILIAFGEELNSKSHPTRVRGLKSTEYVPFAKSDVVAPYAGAWIEICRSGI